MPSEKVVVSNISSMFRVKHDTTLLFPYESGIPLRFFRKGMPVCFKVIQLVCQFPC